MKQIPYVFPRYLHNDEHDQLHSDIENLILVETIGKLGITDQYPVYQQARIAEKAALQVEQGSVYTIPITQSDGYRDDLDLGFELLVESHLHHFDPQVQEKAQRVWRILQQYGTIRKLNYNAESSNMTNRNTELITKYAADVAAIGNGLGTQWLNKLNEANNQFISHFGDRATEASARISGNVLDARIAVDNAFNDITTRINALVVVNGEANYAAFIDKVNYYINYHKETLAARKGRKKDGETEETK
jgi:hypothetical protein